MHSETPAIVFDDGDTYERLSDVSAYRKDLGV